MGLGHSPTAHRFHCARCARIARSAESPPLGNIPYAQSINPDRPWSGQRLADGGCGRVRLIASRGGWPGTSSDLPGSSANLLAASGLQVRRNRKPQRIEPRVFFDDRGRQNRQWHPAPRCGRSSRRIGGRRNQHRNEFPAFALRARLRRLGILLPKVGRRRCHLCRAPIEMSPLPLGRKKSLAFAPLKRVL